MKLTKMISMLIVGLVTMGFASTGMAYNGSIGYEPPDYSWDYEGHDYYLDEKEETTSEAPEEEEIVAEAESETEPMEEEEYTGEEERVAPVAGEGSEEVVPDIY